MQPFIWILLGNAAVIALSIGDTIRVSSSSGINKTTVRLACIDAPETSQAPYGNDARRALQGELAIGAEVSLRTKATDRYGRTVALIIQILISHTKSEGCTIGKLINFYSRQ